LRDIAKRTFDVVGAGVGLAVMAPALGLIAVAVRLSSPGPALFRQTRVGLNGRHFKALKFRTMFAGSDALGRETLGTNDPRITRLGHFLRRTKIDELPQLINVVRGDMSLVGPRPEIPHYADRYAGDDRIVLTVRPGMTDPSSLELSDLDTLMASRGAESPADFYVRVIQPRKLTLQKAYVCNHSLGSDVIIIVKTILRIMRI